MEDRIRKFMDFKSITSSELADTIGVQRSNVTHVLQGRNKPSFQFIEKLLQAYPELNAKWLLLGTGNMVDSPGKSRTLFDQVTDSSLEINKPEQIKTVEKIVVPDQIPTAPSEMVKPNIEEKSRPKEDVNNQIFSSEKPIERLVVFYKDQTFKVYNPSL